MPILSFLIWLPMIGGVLTLLVGDEAKPYLARRVAVVTMLLSLLACVPLYYQFDASLYTMQFMEQLQWLPLLRIHYSLGVDGISLPLIVLTNVTTLLAIFATWYGIQKKIPQYLAALLFLQGIMVGVFCALDSILYYIFWEATLVPMFLIIGIWGSANRVYAATKFFLYTFLGSILMLIAFIYLGFKANTFNILDFYSLKLTFTEQAWIFFALLLAFAIKVPMWPVHTWLPDAHTEAPAGGSIVLAAILLKLGAYGLLRFSLPIVPDACRYFASFMILLSLIAILYIALVALHQKDMKRLIAYSSISHMGFVTLGCFLGYAIVANGGTTTAGGLAMEGALMVMISHGFVSGALFAGVGYLYDRMHSRQINDFGGVVTSMPLFASLFLLFAMANAGLPGTSAFVGEFMVILASVHSNFWIAFFAATTLIFGAAYTLWMYKRVFFGPVVHAKIRELTDISGYESLAFTLFALLVLGFGIYPAPLINLMHGTVGHTLSLAINSKL